MAQDATALADEPSRDELLALACEQEGEAKAHLAMGDKFEARNSIIRAQSLRLRAAPQTPDAVREAGIRPVAHMTVENIEIAFDAWRKTLTVVDRPSNQDIFWQGYVAGWNAKETQLQPQQADGRALLQFVGWVDSWVSNPVGAYSVHALDGLFHLTREKIAVLQQSPATTKEKK